MLQIIVPGGEYFDEDKQEFFQKSEQKLNLEHSLVSISKWESKWHKPFLSDRYPKTDTEVIDYIRCMTTTQNVDPLVYTRLSNNNLEAINSYINDKMTATWFNEIGNHKSSSEVLTNELIYYYMFTFGIPIECQKWHLNRLLTLIRIFVEKNKPPRKMSKNEAIRKQRELNAKRRQAWKSNG
jgi:hypothetical protein